jgi:hypothetical protein
MTYSKSIGGKVKGKKTLRKNKSGKRRGGKKARRTYRRRKSRGGELDYDPILRNYKREAVIIVKRQSGDDPTVNDTVSSINKARTRKAVDNILLENNYSYPIMER